MGCLLRRKKHGWLHRVLAGILTRRGTHKMGRVNFGPQAGALSIDCDSLRNVRAIAMAFTAWLVACGPMACSVGQSTGARA